MALQANFFAATGEAKGQVELPEIVFGTSGNRYVLHEADIAYQVNQRLGTSATKSRGMVRGGGRKPWKQKGTGNARAGSIRSPLWRKGGIIFGPQPRSYRVNLNEAKRLLALQTALFEMAKSSAVVVIDHLKLADKKTSKAANLLKSAAGGMDRCLLVLDKKNAAQQQALRNIEWLDVSDTAELNAWQLLKAKRVIFAKAAIDALAERFPKG